MALLSQRRNSLGLFPLAQPAGPVISDSARCAGLLPQRYPFPSKLYFGRVGNRNLHVAAAIDVKVGHVITAYEPDADFWEADFKTNKSAKKSAARLSPLRKSARKR